MPIFMLWHCKNRNTSARSQIRVI